jgi:hypothetical protein
MAAEEKQAHLFLHSLQVYNWLSHYALVCQVSSDQAVLSLRQLGTVPTQIACLA